MGFFANRFTREGPGTPVPQEGAARYFCLLKTYFWQLLWLSWIFLLSCIPLITIPAALTAASRVCLKLTRDSYCLFWAEYKTEFRRSFLKSLPFGLICAGGLLASYYLLSLGISNNGNPYGMLFSGLGLGALVLDLAWSSYGFVLLAAQDLPVGALVRNAWYLMLLGGRCTLGILAVWAAAMLAVLLLFPLSLGLVAAGLPGVVAYTLCFLVNIPLEIHVFAPYAARQEQEENP